MENKELQLTKNVRYPQSRSSRITNAVFGFILTIIVLIVYQFQDILMLAIGIFFIIYGVIGLEFFKTIYSIRVTNSSLEIVKSYRPDIIIDLDNVAYISLRNNELQVHYSDYVKTYNIPWLDGDDYHELKDKLDEICLEKTKMTDNN